MIPCIIESPFKGTNKAEESRNRAYLDKCIRWCILRGFSPYASHKMLTDALDDSNQAERSDGIAAGLEMAEVILSQHPSARVFFFLDYGESGGMQKAKEHYAKNNRAGSCRFMEIGKL